MMRACCWLVAWLAWSTVALADPVASLPTEVGALREAIAQEPGRADLRAALVDSLDAAGDAVAAADAATECVALEDTASSELRLAGLQLRVQRYALAAAAYGRACQLDPDSADAWIGLQRAQLALGNWRDAAIAGDRARALAPDNPLLGRRQALARYMLGEYATARQFYEVAVQKDPQDAEMRLGLGLTLARLGDLAAGHAQCELAGQQLPGDARVAGCLALQEAKRFSSGMGAWATELRYTQPWEVRQIRATTLAGHVEGPSGAGFWAGGVLSESVLRYSAEDFLQTLLVFGAYGRRGAFQSAASLGRIWATDATIQGAYTGVLQGGWRPGAWGGSVAVASSRYPAQTVVQLDPRLVWQPRSSLRVALGPEVIAIRDDGAAASALWSLHIDASWQPSASVALDCAGAIGPRQHMVEASGLSVWSSDDRFLGGYRVGAQIAMPQRLALRGEFRHEYGDAQAGRSHAFQLIGGTVGLQAEF